MRPSEILTQRKEEIKAIALSRGVKKIVISGSVARGNDRESSGFDFYVEIDSFWSYALISERARKRNF